MAISERRPEGAATAAPKGRRLPPPRGGTRPSSPEPTRGAGLLLGIYPDQMVGAVLSPPQPQKGAGVAGQVSPRPRLDGRPKREDWSITHERGAQSDDRLGEPLRTLPPTGRISVYSVPSDPMVVRVSWQSAKYKAQSAKCKVQSAK